MNINYKINYNALAKATKIQPEAARVIVRQYQDVHRAMEYILRKLFNVQIYSIELINEDKMFSLILEAFFKLHTKVGDFEVIYQENRFKISNNYVSCTFNTTSMGDIILKEYVEKQDKKIIVINFLNREVKMEVHFKEDGQAMVLDIPMDNPSYFDINKLGPINTGMDINALIKFYRNVFYQMQDEYYLNNESTVLSIWQKVKDFQDYREKGYKLDQVTLKNGLVISYQLGAITPNDEEVPLIVLLKDGTFTITGCEEKENVDFNQYIRTLQNRRSKLDK